MHQHPLLSPSQEMIVPQCSGGVQHNIATSPVHIEFIAFMQGVDVADQVGGCPHVRLDCISGGIGYFILFWTSPF